jgi:hypothetical protein
VGRMVFTSRYGPTALPIVYRIDGESIVLGTWDTALFDEDLRTGIADADYQVGLEADQSIRQRVRGGSCWSGARRITWIPRPSARRSSVPGLSRGLRECLRTSSE